MRDRCVRNLRALVAAIALVATLLVSLHHGLAPTETPMTRATAEIAQSIGHSHDSKGSPAQAEDHSHPHCVLPCAATNVWATSSMKLSMTNEFGRGEPLTGLFRPPRPLAL